MLSTFVELMSKSQQMLRALRGQSLIWSFFGLLSLHPKGADGSDDNHSTSDYLIIPAQTLAIFA